MELRYSFFLLDIFLPQVLNLPLEHGLLSNVLLVALELEIRFLQRRHVILQFTDILGILHSLFVEFLFVFS